MLSWSTQISNATGDAYVTVKMPQTPTYNVVYQNASQTPINNALMQLGIDHSPIFLINS